MVQRGGWLRFALPGVGGLRLTVEHGMLSSKLFVEVSGNCCDEAEVIGDSLSMLAVCCLDFLNDVFPGLAYCILLSLC